ncbi:hypothetical protein UA08_02935 [Talaromyces atroroseus]|uniref:Glutamyl-tRNA amidotransferase complex subunit Gta3 domain-containing protein n=1 Tax=Talaromyces atroroseus TaxID=1441469 RepID=A0A225B237_TALAT|nr:hypothetical protein UA08_02935 [Talaromyces atroroseus]OKL62039.1 hypothetical protein UA08_02935 [Talaromyces atroroseus]
MACVQVRLSWPRPLRWANKALAFAAPERHYSAKSTSDDIAALLSKPTWSVQSLLPNTHDSTKPLSITTESLRRLLRLSALPQPVDKAEETKMLKTLESQIHFVRSIQDVETKGISPLQAIRDESREAVKESTIGLKTLKDALAKEKVTGRSKRIQREAAIEDENTGHVEDDQWDGNALGSATKTAGSYPAFAEDQGKKDEKKEHGLSDFLTESQRGDLMVLISVVLEHMRKTVSQNFEAPSSSKAQNDLSEQQNSGDSTHERDLPARSAEESIDTALALNQASKTQALAYFDEWHNSVLLRVGQVLNERGEPQIDQTSFLTSDDNLLEESTNSDKETPSQLSKVYPPFDSVVSDLPKAQRLLVLRSLLLLLLGLEHYSAYSRVLLLHITSSLNLALRDLNDNEAQVARGLLDAAIAMTADEEAKQKAAQNKKARKWKVGVATVAGAALIGITGGLAAPLVAAGFGTIMGGLGLGSTIAATYLGALASSGVVVGGLFGAYGGKMTGKMMDKYAREVEDFAFIPVRGKIQKNLKDEKDAAKEDHRLRVTVGITGWVTEEDNIVVPWRVIGPESEVFALRWEYEALLHLGNSMHALVTTAAWKVASYQVLARTVLAGIMSAVLLPMGIARLAQIAANPFNVAISRADKAGEVLADALINRAQGKRPVTLIGYSLGSRVIYSCLRSLAKRHAYGLIESAILMGSPIPADPAGWQAMRTVVSGRLVNVYSQNDSILALLYRATHLEVDIAGLQPVKGVQNLENVDASTTVDGHLRYQFLVGQVLSDLGFEEVDGVELAKEKTALLVQDKAIEQEQKENERRKQITRKPVPPTNTQHDEKQKEKEEEDEEEEQFGITMIDEEEEARLRQEVEQRTHEQMMNRKMQYLRTHD